MKTRAWQSLVHVCRRWRTLVFGSPRRLDLKLYCSPKTPAKDRLDVWPALPLIIEGYQGSPSNNIIAALKQSDRVRQVDLRLTTRKLKNVLAPMQVPFPELTDLELYSYGKPPAIPDLFLGGSAPRLRFLSLDSISFPGLPKLLPSTTHLVNLCLYGIPHSGYFSPQAMVAPLSVLSSLESLFLHFESPQSRPDLESQSLLPKRSVFPALAKFHFKGTTEYLEEFVTLINTPQLTQMVITFFNQIDFDCPRLAQFINCTPTLKVFDEVHVRFDDNTASVILESRTSKFPSDYLQINISCRGPDWQLSFIEQVCNTSLLRLLMVEDLYIEHRCSRLVWNSDAIESTLWLQLLLPFTAVKNLYLSKEFTPGITDALQELVGGRITEVLPSLQNIFVERLKLSGSFHEKIGQFVSARQLSDRPITVSDWERMAPIRS